MRSWAVQRRRTIEASLRSRQVGVEYLVPVRFGDLRPGFAMVDGGVVDQDVDGTELGGDPLRHRVDGLPVRNIDFEREGATACHDDLVDHPVELLLRPAGDRDGGAGRGQRRTDPRPEPTTTTRDNGDPPI